MSKTFKLIKMEDVVVPLEEAIRLNNELPSAFGYLKQNTWYGPVILERNELSLDLQKLMDKGQLFYTPTKASIAARV